MNPEVVKAGKYKDIGSAARKMTTKERGLLNEMIENVHDQFIMDIFKVREKKIKGGLDGLKEYAQGQIFSGQGAMNRGLVDEIAGLWEAGRRIHKEMKLEGDFDLKFIKLKKDVSFFDIVRGLEESVENLNFKAKTELIPLLLYKPQV